MELNDEPLEAVEPPPDPVNQRAVLILYYGSSYGLIFMAAAGAFFGMFENQLPPFFQTATFGLILIGSFFLLMAGLGVLGHQLTDSMDLKKRFRYAFGLNLLLGVLCTIAGFLI